MGNLSPSTLGHVSIAAPDAAPKSSSAASSILTQKEVRPNPLRCAASWPRGTGRGLTCRWHAAFPSRVDPQGARALVGDCPLALQQFLLSKGQRRVWCTEAWAARGTARLSFPSNSLLSGRQPQAGRFVAALSAPGVPAHVQKANRMKGEAVARTAYRCIQWVLDCIAADAGASSSRETVPWKTMWPREMGKRPEVTAT